MFWLGWVGLGWVDAVFRGSLHGLVRGHQGVSSVDGLLPRK